MLKKDAYLYWRDANSKNHDVVRCHEDVGKVQPHGHRSAVQP